MNRLPARGLPPPGDAAMQPTVACPRVYGWNAELMLVNLDVDLRKLWEQMPEPKLFVYLWDSSYHENAAPTILALHATIANLLGIPPPHSSPTQCSNAAEQSAHSAMVFPGS